MIDKKKIIVSLLFVIFGWSSWIDVNGLWVELPLLVQRLPEKWSLPAYIVIITQFANIGPLVYAVIHLLKKYKCDAGSSNHRLETGAIYIIILVGMVSTLLLALYWHETSFIGGVEHSTVLLTLVFFLSLVDCTSSVTFLPFLTHFKPTYVTPFYIGEGLSGLIPAVIAFIQGSGEYTCVSSHGNSSTNGTGISNSSTNTLYPKYADLLFRVEDFFGALCGMLFVSAIAFSLLRFSSYCNSELAVEYESTEGSSVSVVDENDGDDQPTNKSANASGDSIVRSSSPMIVKDSSTAEESFDFRAFIVLLVIMACICALANGVLPSIQIYSLLPYGQIYYSVGVKLATLANPLACFIGFCAVPHSYKIVGTLTTIVALSSTYILVIASYSPLPPIHGDAAAVVMVLVWVIFTAAVYYLKVLLSKMLLKRGHSALFWLGVATQIGSFSGAIVTFICTTVFKLFHSAPYC